MKFSENEARRIIEAHGLKPSTIKEKGSLVQTPFLFPQGSLS